MWYSLKKRTCVSNICSLCEIFFSHFRHESRAKLHIHRARDNCAAMLNTQTAHRPPDDDWRFAVILIEAHWSPCVLLYFQQPFPIPSVRHIHHMWHYNHDVSDGIYVWLLGCCANVWQDWISDGDKMINVCVCVCGYSHLSEGDFGAIARSFTTLFYDGFIDMRNRCNRLCLDIDWCVRVVTFKLNWFLLNFFERINVIKWWYLYLYLIDFVCTTNLNITFNVWYLK